MAETASKMPQPPLPSTSKVQKTEENLWSFNVLFSSPGPKIHRKCSRDAPEAPKLKLKMAILPLLWSTLEPMLAHLGSLNRHHTYIRTYIHTYIHTCMHTYIHTYIHACMHAYIHTYIHTCIDTCIHTYMHAYIHTYIHTCMHTYIHTCMHACIHTHIHTYIHTYEHTYCTYIHTSRLAHGIYL